MVMNDCNQPDPVCPKCPDGPGRLDAWFEMLPHVRQGSTCAESYVPFFEDATELIRAQCDVFVPQ